MVANRFWTVMIIPDAKSRVRTILVRRSMIVAGLILVVGAIAAFAIVLSGYSSARQRAALLLRQVNRLRSSQVPMQRVQQLARRIEEMKRRIAQAGLINSRVATMIGLQDEVAVGGGEPAGRSDAFSGFYKSKQKELLAQLQDELAVLEVQADEERARANALQSYLDGHKKLLSSIPSVTPVHGGWISSGFGYRIDPFTHRRAFHKGVDISSPRGTPIVATADGVVIKSGWISNWGYVVEVDHGNGFTTWFGHCSKLLVKRGDRVRRGEVIALVGSTGRSTGPHLHYEVRLNGRPQNPMHYMLDRN